MMTVNTIISTDELNNEMLLKIFQDAYIEAKEDQDGDIVVETESKNFIYLNFLDRTDLIHLSAFFNINTEANKNDILELLNILNHKIVFSRFSMPEPNLLIAEYFFSYKQGILPHAIINALRLFEKITWSALRQYDTKNLIG